MCKAKIREQRAKFINEEIRIEYNMEFRRCNTCGISLERKGKRQYIICCQCGQMKVARNLELFFK